MTHTYTFGTGWTTTQPEPVPMKGRAIDRIARETAARYFLPVSELKSPNRNTYVCRARFEAMWLTYQERRPDGTRLYSLPTIGKYYGRDHTSVLNALRRHEARLAAEKVAA